MKSYFSKEYHIHIVDRVDGEDSVGAGLIVLPEKCCVIGFEQGQFICATEEIKIRANCQFGG